MLAERTADGLPEPFTRNRLGHVVDDARSKPRDRMVELMETGRHHHGRFRVQASQLLREPEAISPPPGD